MMAGDGLCDGEVNNQDKNDVWEYQYGNNNYLPGDLNLDGNINIEDSILGLKVITLYKPAVNLGSEVDGDGKIIYIGIDIRHDEM